MTHDITCTTSSGSPEFETSVQVADHVDSSSVFFNDSLQNGVYEMGFEIFDEGGSIELSPKVYTNDSGLTIQQCGIIQILLEEDNSSCYDLE